MTDVKINDEGYAEIHNAENTLYRELSVTDGRQPKIKIKTNGYSIKVGSYSLSEILAFGTTRCVLTAHYKPVNTSYSKVIKLSDLSSYMSEISVFQIWAFDPQYQEGSLGSALTDDVSFLSIDGVGALSGEAPLLSAAIDADGAKTTYLQSSGNAMEMSRDGAKFLVNKIELSDKFTVDWDNAEEIRRKVSNLGTNSTINGRWGAKVRPLNVRFYNDGTQVGDGWTTVLSASFTFVSKPFKPIAATISGSDGNAYYDSGLDADSKVYYKTPVGMTYKVTYDNGSTTEVSCDASSVSYYSDETLTTSMIGQQVKPLTPVYVKITMDDFVSNAYSFTIMPTVLEDTCDSVCLSEKATMTLTAQPSMMQKAIKLKATFKSGYVMDGIEYTGGADGYSFYQPNSYYMAKGDPFKVCVNMFGHTSGWFDISGDPNLSFTDPLLSGATVEKGQSLSTTIINGTPINLTDTTVKVTYDTGYTFSVPFNDDTAVTKNCFRVSSTTDAALDGYAYDGKNPATVELGDGVEKDVTAKLIIYDSYGNSQIGKALTLTFIEITNVIGMTYENAKTEYKVGEAFLNGDDTTKVRLWYDDNGTKKSTAVYLNGSFGTLSIQPHRGYVFTSAGKVTVRVQSIFDTTKYFTYDITVKSAVTLSSDTETVNYRFVKYQGSGLNYETEDGSVAIAPDTYIKLLEEDCVKNADGSWSAKNAIASSYDGDGIKIHGYLSNVGDSEHNGVLVDFNDCVPPITGASNMTVEFPCYEDGMSDFIDGCTFGTRFGHNNSLNRLFVSGNPGKPNYDCHSVEPNTVNEDEGTQVKEGDFSYFPDEALCKYGESENSIVGYNVISDSKLMVLKTKSGKEKTIYFRVPTTVTMIDSSGTAMTDVSGNTLTQEEYSIYMSNSSVAGISPSTVANFNGDALFVDDDNEIAGLDVQGIIGDSQRQANSRSYRIDRKLREFDLSNANLETYGRYLFLDIPGVACFVADRETLSGSQYEWWRLDSMDSRCFMELDGELYYSTEDGMLCKLNGSMFSDKDRYFTDVALAKIGFDSDVVVNSEYTDRIDDGYDYAWELLPDDEDDIASWLYARILDAEADMIDGEGNVVKISDSSVIKRLGSKNSFWLNPLDGDFKDAYRKPFRLYREDDGLTESAAEYGLYDNDGNRVDLSGPDYSSGFEICVRLEGEVTAKKAGEGELKLYDGFGLPYDIVRYANQSDSMSISGVLIKSMPIKSRLVSAPLLISTANWFKHIIKIDISQGTNEVSDLCVAYCNNKIPYIVEDDIKDRGQVIDLGDFSFTDVDFSENFYTRTYTIGRELKCVKYACVAFASDKGMNSVVPAVSLTYILSRLSKGIGD